MYRCCRFQSRYRYRFQSRYRFRSHCRSRCYRCHYLRYHYLRYHYHPFRRYRRYLILYQWYLSPFRCCYPCRYFRCCRKFRCWQKCPSRSRYCPIRCCWDLQLRLLRENAPNPNRCRPPTTRPTLRSGWLEGSA